MMARHTRRSLSLAAEKENNVPQEEVRRKKKRQDEQTGDEVASQPPKKPLVKKRKKPPMEEDDGFQFRARRKSTRLSNRQSLSAGFIAEPMTSSDPPAPAPPPIREEKKPKKIPKLKPPPEEPPAKPAKTTKTKKPARRKDDVTATARPRSPPPRRQHPQEITMEDNVQSTEATRIRLRTNDTPVADRKRPNKYRQSGAGARRSSVGLRGRRASSLIQDGIVAEPHPTIDTKEYYKHINQDLMEFMRMQQLLTWCGHKVLNQSPSAARRSAKRAELNDAAALPIARVIQEEILKEITTNGTLSNWMARDTSSSLGPPVIKKANPENEKNLKKLEELKEELRKLDEEREAWRLLEEMNPEELLAIPKDMDPMLQIPAASAEAGASSSSATEPAAADAPLITAKTLLDTPESQRATALLTASHDLLLSAKDVVTRHASDLEFQVDQLADACHRINMYADVADNMAGRMLETVERRLDEKDRRLKERVGTEGLSTLEVLRGLSRFSD